MKKIAKFAVEIEYDDSKIKASPEDGDSVYQTSAENVNIRGFEQVGEFRGIMLALFSGVFGTVDRDDPKEALKRKAELIMAFSSAYVTAFMNLAPEEDRNPLVREMFSMVALIVVRSIGQRMGFSNEEISQILKENDEQGTEQTDFESFL